MKKWETAVVRKGEEQPFLNEGWEPFAVCPHDESFRFYNTTEKVMQAVPRTTDYIHLRRAVMVADETHRGVVTLTK